MERPNFNILTRRGFTCFRHVNKPTSVLIPDLPELVHKVWVVAFVHTLHQRGKIVVILQLTCRALKSHCLPSTVFKVRNHCVERKVVRVEWKKPRPVGSYHLSKLPELRGARHYTKHTRTKCRLLIKTKPTFCWSTAVTVSHGDHFLDCVFEFGYT